MNLDITATDPNGQNSREQLSVPESQDPNTWRNNLAATYARNHGLSENNLEFGGVVNQGETPTVVFTDRSNQQQHRIQIHDAPENVRRMISQLPQGSQSQSASQGGRSQDFQTASQGSQNQGDRSQSMQNPNQGQNQDRNQNQGTQGPNQGQNQDRNQGPANKQQDQNQRK